MLNTTAYTSKPSSLSDITNTLYVAKKDNLNYFVNSYKDCCISCRNIEKRVNMLFRKKQKILSVTTFIIESVSLFNATTTLLSTHVI